MVAPGDAIANAAQEQSKFHAAMAEYDKCAFAPNRIAMSMAGRATIRT